VKGKIAYMPPEQLRGQAVDRRCDVYAMGVVLWEALTGQRLFRADSEGETVTKVLEHAVVAPSRVRDSVPKALDAVVLKALARDPGARYGTARDMAAAIEAAVRVASARGVGTFVQTVAGHLLDERKRVVADLEQRADDDIGGSLVSNVSMATDATAAPRRRFTVIALAMVAVVGTTAAWLGLRQHARAAPVMAPPIMSTAVASSADTTTVAPPPSAVVSALPSAPRAATPARTVGARRAPPGAPSSDKPCPVKTFVDADGIVQFRRECP
jgi:hypothetical protein